MNQSDVRTCAIWSSESSDGVAFLSIFYHIKTASRHVDDSLCFGQYTLSCVEYEDIAQPF